MQRLVRVSKGRQSEVTCLDIHLDTRSDIFLAYLWSEFECKSGSRPPRHSVASTIDRNEARRFAERGDNATGKH